MDIDKAIEIAKGVSDVAPDVYNDLAHKSAENVGDALGTVTDFLNTILTPLELINKTIKIKKETFLDEYKNNISKIPKEKVCSPNFALVGPMIEHLKYKITEDDLRQKYAILLSETSNSDSLSKPLLSFDNVLDQLSPYEVELLHILFSKVPQQVYPLASIKVTSEIGYTFPFKNISDISFKNLPSDTITIMISNLERLGIVNIDYQQFVEPNERYNFIYESPIFIQLQKSYQIDREKTKLPYPECIIEKHMYSLTSFGISFVNTVIC